MAWQQPLEATTATGRGGALWEALYTAVYWAQGSPNVPTEACIRKAEAMRNYQLNDPFDDNPFALPWPTDRPETVRNLAELLRNREKASMQVPEELLLWEPDEHVTQPFVQTYTLPVTPPPVR